MITVPLLGILKPYPDIVQWLQSDPVKVDVLGGADCSFILENYDEDEHKEEFHTAIENFFSIDQTVLKNAQDSIFEYCKIMTESREGWSDKVKKSEDIWPLIQLGDEVVVTRRNGGDKLIYISLDCNCDWDTEHGLQIVFKQGLYVNKVGQYDGHLTTSDSYDNIELEDVVFAAG